MGSLGAAALCLLVASALPWLRWGLPPEQLRGPSVLHEPPASPFPSLFPLPSPPCCQGSAQPQPFLQVSPCHVGRVIHPALPFLCFGGTVCFTQLVPLLRSTC